MEGYVRKIFLEKGFAFIEGSDERDYFLHWSKVSRASVPFRNIKEGDKVVFEFEEGNNGPKALNVLVIRGTQNARTESDRSRARTNGDSGNEDAADVREVSGTSGAGTEDQRSGVDDLTEYSDIVRRDDADRSGRPANDEAGDRRGEEGGAPER